MAVIDYGGEAFRALLSAGVLIIIAMLGWVVRQIQQVAHKQDVISDIVLGDRERGMEPLVDWQTKTTTMLTNVQKEVSTVKSEVTTNGGASMKDVLRRVDIRSERTERKFDQHLEDAEVAKHVLDNHIRNHRYYPPPPTEGN